MVRIKNITDTGNAVSMDCLKEGDPERCFRLVMDKEGNIVSGPENDAYSAHARWKIKKLIESGATLPKEACSYWY